jgi:hypothetical protein
MSEKLQILFAVLGVVLTAASVIASVKQYEAASLQAKAAIATLTPQIQVTTNLLRDEVGYYAEQLMIISNTGGPAYNIRHEVATWITIVNSANKEERIPLLLSYYDSSSSTGNLNGQLVTYWGHQNNKRMVNLEKLIREGCEQKCFMKSAQTLVHISYEDALSNKIERYVLLDGNVTKYLLTQEGYTLWQRAISEKGVSSVSLEVLQEKQAVESWLQSYLPVAEHK